MAFIERIPREVFLSGSAVPLVRPTRSLDGAEDDVRERHDIGYLCNIVDSWRTYVESEEKVNLPTFADVSAAGANTVPEFADFDRDGLVWPADFRIMRRREHGAMWKRLVIHLANDGFFYCDESLLEIARSDVSQNRHATCTNGWAVMDAKTVLPKLGPIVAFARQWFGYDAEKTLRKLVLYHAEANRVDVCIRCDESHVALEFSFEPMYPVKDVPEEFWTD